MRAAGVEYGDRDRHLITFWNYVGLGQLELARAVILSQEKRIEKYPQWEKLEVRVGRSVAASLVKGRGLQEQIDTGLQINLSEALPSVAHVEWTLFGIVCGFIQDEQDRIELKNILEVNFAAATVLLHAGHPFDKRIRSSAKPMAKDWMHEEIVSLLADSKRCALYVLSKPSLGKMLFDATSMLLGDHPALYQVLEDIMEQSGSGMEPEAFDAMSSCFSSLFTCSVIKTEDTVCSRFRPFLERGFLKSNDTQNNASSQQYICDVIIRDWAFVPVVRDYLLHEAGLVIKERDHFVSKTISDALSCFDQREEDSAFGSNPTSKFFEVLNPFVSVDAFCALVILIAFSETTLPFQVRKPVLEEFRDRRRINRNSFEAYTAFQLAVVRECDSQALFVSFANWCNEIAGFSREEIFSELRNGVSVLDVVSRRDGLLFALSGRILPRFEANCSPNFLAELSLLRCAKTVADFHKNFADEDLHGKSLLEVDLASTSPSWDSLEVDEALLCGEACFIIFCTSLIRIHGDNLETVAETLLSGTDYLLEKPILRARTALLASTGGNAVSLSLLEKLVSLANEVRTRVWTATMVAREKSLSDLLFLQPGKIPPASFILFGEPTAYVFMCLEQKRFEQAASIASQFGLGKDVIELCSEAGFLSSTMKDFQQGDADRISPQLVTELRSKASKESAGSYWAFFADFALRGKRKDQLEENFEFIKAEVLPNPHVDEIRWFNIVRERLNLLVEKAWSPPSKLLTSAFPHLPTAHLEETGRKKSWKVNYGEDAGILGSNYIVELEKLVQETTPNPPYPYLEVLIEHAKQADYLLNLGTNSPPVSNGSILGRKRFKFSILDLFKRVFEFPQEIEIIAKEWGLDFRFLLATAFQNEASSSLDRTRLAELVSKLRDLDNPSRYGGYWAEEAVPPLHMIGKYIQLSLEHGESELLNRVNFLASLVARGEVDLPLGNTPVSRLFSLLSLTESGSEGKFRVRKNSEPKYSEIHEPFQVLLNSKIEGTDNIQCQSEMAGNGGDLGNSVFQSQMEPLFREGANESEAMGSPKSDVDQPYPQIYPFIPLRRQKRDESLNPWSAARFGELFPQMLPTISYVFSDAFGALRPVERAIYLEKARKSALANLAKSVRLQDRHAVEDSTKQLFVLSIIEAWRAISMRHQNRLCLKLA